MRMCKTLAGLTALFLTTAHGVAYATSTGESRRIDQFLESAWKAQDVTV